MNFWPRAAVPLATFAAVSLALLSWESFLIDVGNFWTPALLIGLAITGTGIAGRSLHLARGFVVLGQAVVGAMVMFLITVGTPLPVTGAARSELREVFSQASSTAWSDQAPVAVSDGVGAWVIFGAFGCYLLADLIAVTLRRGPLAGLVLLVIVAVPISVPRSGMSWWTFALTALGYLLLLVVHEKDRVARWGQRLDAYGAGIAPSHGPGRRTIEAGTAAIGASATALAVVLPVAIPTLSLDLVGLGAGGDDGSIRVTNPTVGMYDDLRDQSDTAAITVQADQQLDRPPSYLRIATLTAFNGREWTPGQRKVPSEQTADGKLEPPPGGKEILGEEVTYRLTASKYFESRWLPTFVHTSSITAEGPWRYDAETTDFLATDTDGEYSLAGSSWEVTAAPMTPDPELLRSADSSESQVDARFTALPTLPDRIGEIAREHTDDYSSPFEKAVALQNWFARSGEFEYSLTRPGTVKGTGADDLLEFLTENRIGYCQQFATAMAAMARELDIPSRVAVGFLHSEELPDGRFIFRERDLHSWPELWFDGVGWVRFDPTPPDRGTTVPIYTEGVLGQDGSESPNQANQPVPGGETGAGPTGNDNQQDERLDDETAVPDASGEDEESRTGAVLGFLALAGVVLTALVLVTPALIRRRRRATRLNGGPEAGWAEIRDTAIDLRMGWSDTVSPRAAGDWLRSHLPSEDSRAALRRVVTEVERGRYARTPGDAEIHEDVEQVRLALIEGASKADVRRARWWPLSVRRRERKPRTDLFSTDLADQAV